MIRSKGSENGVSIELTPIIDMVFLLLIFFLVATTFHQTEREMQVALPAAISAGPISATLREIIINVDAEGRIRTRPVPSFPLSECSRLDRSAPSRRLPSRNDLRSPTS